MKILKLGMIAAMLFIMGGNTGAFAQLRTGDPAPDFTLPDTHGQAHSLSQQAGKYVVLEWMNEECPFVVKHYKNGDMQALQAEMAEEGVVWYLIASSAPGQQGYNSPQEWNQILSDFGAEVEALLLDPAGEVGRTFGAQTTPHMYLIDPQGTLVYQGAIDSIRSADPADVPRATNYLRQAYEEVTSGRPVSEPSTKAYGCSVKYAN